MSDDRSVWVEFHDDEIKKREKEIERLKDEIARQWVQNQQDEKAKIEQLIEQLHAVAEDFTNARERLRKARELVGRFADAVHVMERHDGERIDCKRAECTDARAYLAEDDDGDDASACEGCGGTCIGSGGWAHEYRPGVIACSACGHPTCARSKQPTPERVQVEQSYKRGVDAAAAWLISRGDRLMAEEMVRFVNVRQGCPECGLIGGDHDADHTNARERLRRARGLMERAVEEVSVHGYAGVTKEMRVYLAEDDDASAPERVQAEQSYKRGVDAAAEWMRRRDGMAEFAHVMLCDLVPDAHSPADPPAPLKVHRWRDIKDRHRGQLTEETPTEKNDPKVVGTIDPKKSK